MAEASRDLSQRREMIRAGAGDTVDLAPGVHFRELTGATCAAKGLTTGTATFEPASAIPYHTHPFCEAITVLSGDAEIAVEGRIYLLGRFDCLSVPTGTAHAVRNCSQKLPMLALSAFASATVSRAITGRRFPSEHRGLGVPNDEDPESMVRFEKAATYELSPDAVFVDLFAGRLGAVGICGGYGQFQPGASLPCHVHQFDESITIVDGEATCLVQGERYKLSGHDTAFVPEGRPHRFLNESNSSMAMLWVYAGSEPERTLVAPGLCDKTLVWLAAENVRPTSHA